MKDIRLLSAALAAVFAGPPIAMLPPEKREPTKYDLERIEKAKAKRERKRKAKNLP